MFFIDGTVSSLVWSSDGLVHLEVGFTNSALHISAGVTYSYNIYTHFM